MFDMMKIARMGLIAMGALAAWGVAVWNHDRKVVNDERVRVEKKSTENAKKADAARRSVDKLPADRLRDRWYRDC